MADSTKVVPVVCVAGGCRVWGDLLISKEIYQQNFYIIEDLDSKLFLNILISYWIIYAHGESHCWLRVGLPTFYLNCKSSSLLPAESAEVTY